MIILYMNWKKSHLLCLANKIMGFVLKGVSVVTLMQEASQESYAEERHDLIYILKGSL